MLFLFPRLISESYSTRSVSQKVLTTTSAAMPNLSTSSENRHQEYDKDYTSQGKLLRELIMGFRTTQIIATAAKLDLAARLENGPQSAAQLAAATKTNEERLYRLLRALTSLGILEKNQDATFSLAPLGNLLRDDVPGSLRNVAILYGEPWLWEAYAQLPLQYRKRHTCF